MSAPTVEIPTDDAELAAQAAALAELEGLGAPPVTPDAPPAKRGRGRPRKDGTPAGAPRAPRVRAPRPPRKASPRIADGMAQLYTMVGLAVAVVPSGRAVAVPDSMPAGVTITGVVGTQLVANAAPIGAAWEEAAKADARVREALERLLAVSVLGQIVAAHVPVVLAGLVAAGAAPATLVPGFSPVDVTEAGRP